MERRARVLVVDDSVVVRSLLSRLLGEDPEIQVVGTSANGRLALRRLAQDDVDVAIMDIDMPEMDGLTTLRVVRKEHPRVKVIMFSTLTEAGATATIDSLAFGAHDYVTKPSTTGGTEHTAAAVRDELIRKIKVACFGELFKPRAATVTAPPQPKTPLPPPPPTVPIDIVAIGASTGGPNALTQVLTELRPNFPVPIVIVQHMPPMFTKILAERLDNVCKLSVREAVDGGIIEPGVVWLAQGGSHMVVSRDQRFVIRLNQDAPVNFCRPAVDVLFQSVAATYGARALGLVLTGMGQDGLRGAELLRNAGARMLVQDRESSVVWGMPGYIARANLAHEILPLSAVSEALERTVQSSRRIGPPAPALKTGSAASPSR